MIDEKQMIQAHVYIGNKLTLKPMLRHAPRLGDELRLNDDTYVEVVTVVWCLDEPRVPYTRINIGTVNIES
jgi:hypothetical protein